MGCGFVLVVKKDQVEAVEKALTEAGDTVFVMGTIKKGDEKLCLK